MKRTELTHEGELKARRFRACVLKEDGLGCKVEGEFFYKTARGARAFVVREFDAWCETQQVEFGMGAEDWREVWRDYTMVIASVKNEEGPSAIAVKTSDADSDFPRRKIHDLELEVLEVA